MQIAHAIAMGSEEGWETQRMRIAITAASQFMNLDREGTERLIKENTEEALRAARDYGLEDQTGLLPAPVEKEQDVQPASRRTRGFIISPISPSRSTS